MSKYLIQTEVDLDFQKFFDEIPEGLFSPDDKGTDEVYERECIFYLFTDMVVSNINQLVKNLNSKHAPYLKHHDEINVEVAKQLSKNLNITKIC